MDGCTFVLSVTGGTGMGTRVTGMGMADVTLVEVFFWGGKGGGGGIFLEAAIGGDLGLLW
jgi:hypothetical protein